MGNENNVGYRQLEFAPVFEKIKKLQSDRRFRDSKELFFAEGVRNFVEAVDHNFSIDTLIYSEKLLISPLARKLTRQLKRNGIPFVRAAPEQFRTVSKTERASGVAAVFRQRIQKIDQVKPNAHICWTALTDIRSPGNLGTLLRTSAATGAGGIILIGDRIDPYDPNVVRATMGAIFKQKIVRADIKQFHQWIESHKIQVVGASPGGSIEYDRMSYGTPTVLMLGNERSGLTPEEQLICHQTVRIPMVEGTDSLNVAVAGSLLLYQVFRSLPRK